MNTSDFPNPRLNLPKEFRDSNDDHANASFEAIEKYLELVADYIYTDINLDYDRSDSRHIHAWIQKLISANVLRSLYLRNAFVEMFNARNTVGIFLPLKAWFETVGVLASILDLLESNLSAEDLFTRLQPFVVGNRGKGSLRVGDIDAINVSTMIEKADKYMKKMRGESVMHSSEPNTEQFFTDYYDLASNPSHPSFDAYEVIGALHDGGTWRAKRPEEVRDGIVKDRPSYGGLLMSPMFVTDLCEKLFEIESEHFNTLRSQHYFD